MTGRTLLGEPVAQKATSRPAVRSRPERLTTGGNTAGGNQYAGDRPRSTEHVSLYSPGVRDVLLRARGVAFGIFTCHPAAVTVEVKLTRKLLPRDAYGP